MYHLCEVVEAFERVNLQLTPFKNLTESTEMLYSDGKNLVSSREEGEQMKAEMEKVQIKKLESCTFTKRKHGS